MNRSQWIENRIDHLEMQIDEYRPLAEIDEEAAEHLCDLEIELHELRSDQAIDS